MAELATPISSVFSLTRRWKWVLPLLALAVVTSAIWSLGVGAVAISPRVIINTLFNLPGETQPYIIMNSRLPRIVLAVLCGGALALSGAIIQAVIRNPLASPGIIGINSGAALGALVLVMCLPTIPVAYMPLAASIGGVAAAAIVIIAGQLRNLSAAHVALVGVAVGFVFESGVDYLLVISTSRESASPLIWLTGSLWGRTWTQVELAALPLCSLAILAFILAHRMDVIGLGRTTATGLGLNVPRQHIILLGLATFLASIAVSVVGVVGFIGLMAPHIARRLVGGTHHILLPAATLVGMLLLVAADGIGRAIAPPIEVSAGILAALIGAPFFISIMFTTQSEAKQ